MKRFTIFRKKEIGCDQNAYYRFASLQTHKKYLYNFVFKQKNNFKNVVNKFNCVSLIPLRVMARRLKDYTTSSCNINNIMKTINVSK